MDFLSPLYRWGIQRCRKFKMACELTDFFVMLQLWILVNVTIQGSLPYAWAFIGKIKRNNKKIY